MTDNTQKGNPDDDSLAIAMLDAADAPEPVIDWTVINDAEDAARLASAQGLLTFEDRTMIMNTMREAAHGHSSRVVDDAIASVGLLAVRSRLLTNRPST